MLLLQQEGFWNASYYRWSLYIKQEKKVTNSLAHIFTQQKDPLAILQNILSLIVILTQFRV